VATRSRPADVPTNRASDTAVGPGGGGGGGRAGGERAGRDGFAGGTRAGPSVDSTTRRQMQ